MADETKFRYIPMYVVTIIFIGFLIYLLISRNGQVVRLSSSSQQITECVTCTPVVASQSLTGGNGGQKRALLIGCNYDFVGSVCIEEGCTLNGCIQDVMNVSSYLSETAGFSSERIELLVDNGTTAMPTKQTIINKLEALIAATRPGDTAFIWFSGHGAQLPNSGADQGYDECWCPPDTLRQGNYLTDNTLNTIFSKAPQNSTVFVGSDSCHSGTIVDLPYFLSPENQTVMSRQLPPHVKELRGKRAVITDDMKDSVPEILRSVQSNMTVIQDSSFPVTSSNVLCLSGCQDWDTSADGFEDGIPQGAMTWAFLSSIGPNVSLSLLLSSMRALLKSNYYAQVPQLSMGTLFDPNTTTLFDVLSV